MRTFLAIALGWTALIGMAMLGMWHLGRHNEVLTRRWYDGGN